MKDDEKEKDDLLSGTSERKIDVLKVGDILSKAGTIKITSSEERITGEGILERVTNTAICVCNCGHLNSEVGGQCLCGLWWCRNCAEKFGNCIVCGKLCCPNDSDSTILDRNKRYHKACWLESVKRKIFG